MSELPDYTVELEDGFGITFHRDSQENENLFLYSHCCGIYLNKEQAQKIVEVLMLKFMEENREIK